MGIYSGWGEGGGGRIFGRKNTSICNVLNVLLFFLFSIIKLVFWHISRCARCKICSKLTRKTPKYVKLIKLTIKTPLTSFWPLYCYIWTYFTSCYSVSIVGFDQLIAGWGCCLLFWRFVPGGINLGEVSTFEETKWIIYASKMYENTWGSDIFNKLDVS